MAKYMMPVTLRITDAHYRRLQRLAREAGVAVPTICRRLIKLAVKDALRTMKKKKGG